MLGNVQSYYYHSAASLVNPVVDACENLAHLTCHWYARPQIEQLSRSERVIWWCQEKVQGRYQFIPEQARRIATYATAWLLLMTSGLASAFAGYVSGSGMASLGLVQLGGFTKTLSKALFNIIVVSHYLLGYALPKWLVSGGIPAIARVAFRAIAYSATMTLKALDRILFYAVKALEWHVRLVGKIMQVTNRIFGGCVRKMFNLLDQIVRFICKAMAEGAAAAERTIQALQNALKPMLTILHGLIEQSLALGDAIGRQLRMQINAIAEIVRVALAALVQSSRDAIHAALDALTTILA